MLVARLLLPYSFIIILLHSILIFGGKLPSAPPFYSPLVVDDDDYHCFDNNNNQQLLNSLPKPQKWLQGFGTLNTIATVITVLVILLNILVYKLTQLHEESNSGDKRNVSEILCRRFSLAEILSATNDFDDSLVIGRGGFGNVYKGTIDNGTNTVAIKRLNSMSKQGAPEFWTEITMLSKFRHSHLVSLIGYCDSNNEMILIYEYMARGTIADHLYKIGKNDSNNVPLCWVQRLKICIGAARGLDYLHTGTGTQHRVIHRDVKSSNILLDENWAAKISDFGLSKVGPANQSCTTHVSTHVKGTFGYLDPEYFLTRRLTRKSDVYAFGVVLFEVLCGRPAVDLRLHEDQRGLAGWAQHCVKERIVERIIDPNLKWEIFPDSLSAFVKVADRCLHVRPRKRPTMTEVVFELECALTLQERRDYSMVEEDIFNDGESYDTQYIVDSSTKEKLTINGINIDGMRIVKTGTLGRLAQGIKVLSEGGYENIFRQSFETVAGEQLQNSYSCYLSTSAGPVMGVLYISTQQLAFCSDNPVSYKAGEQMEWTYIKVVIQLNELKAVNPSARRTKRAEKYIQVISVDNNEFRYMGFLNYDGAVNCLEEAMIYRNL